MLYNRITRRPRALVPFLPAPFTTLPFANVMDDLAVRADELMRDTFGELPVPAAKLFPAVNVVEKKEEYIVTAELPGLVVKDVKIEFTDGVLTIQGEKEEKKEEKDEEKTYHLWERRFGTFQRSLPFPGGINEEKIMAEFKEGVLTIHLPKLEVAKVKTRAILIEEKK